VYSLKRTLALTSTKVSFFFFDHHYLANSPIVDGADSLMENAPDWKESNATESEADVS
jgi:hypothetical protein